jgi:AraC-like DNA-binding protein
MKDGTLLNKLADWFNKFKRYTVTYKNGCFNLSSLNNSPYTVIESFDKMPFCKHNRIKNHLTADTLFFNANLYYCQLEEGFWVFVSNLNFKKNVLMTNLYEKELPIEYHFINMHLKSKTVATKSTINGLILKDKTWSMFKAGHAISEYHFKHSKEKNITIFFTTKWLEHQKTINPVFKESKLVEFFNSTSTYLLLDEEDGNYEKIYDEMLLLAKQEIDTKRVEGIKKYANRVMFNFIDKLNSENITESHFKLTDKDRKCVQQIEKHLNDNLFGDFPGIEKIAAMIGVSPTKVKSSFKSIHNKTLFQYFSSQQMQLAYQLLLQKKHSIKEVASMLGYENAGKFSAVFKKNFDCTPSQLLNTDIES